MDNNNRKKRLPRAASLLRVTALAAVLMTAVTTRAQKCDIRINGGSVTANGGETPPSKAITKGDAIGGGTLTVSAPAYVTVKAGADAQLAETFDHKGATTLTEWLKGKVYANTELTKYNVTARIHENGWGTVKINGVATPTGSYSFGDKLTLTATPAGQQYVFIGWYTNAADSTLITENATLNYTVNAEHDTTFLAVFANEVKISVVANPEDGGDVTVTSDQELRPGEEQYDPQHTIYGSHVTVTAKANSQWAFKGWFDADNNTMLSGKLTYSFEATRDMNLEARFTDEVIYVKVKK